MVGGKMVQDQCTGSKAKVSKGEPLNPLWGHTRMLLLNAG